MKNWILTLLIAVVVSGCAEKIEREDQFSAVVTFPVNNICHGYASGLTGSKDKFEVTYRPFSIKLDAFPQIGGFIELRSNQLVHVELQNEGLRMMDNCFARAKTTVDVATPEAWLNAGESIQFKVTNGVPIHALVLNGSQVEIYYHYDDTPGKGNQQSGAQLANP